MGEDGRETLSEEWRGRNRGRGGKEIKGLSWGSRIRKKEFGNLDGRLSPAFSLDPGEPLIHSRVCRVPSCYQFGQESRFLSLVHFCVFGPATSVPRCCGKRSFCRGFTENEDGFVSGLPAIGIRGRICRTQDLAQVYLGVS